MASRGLDEVLSSAEPARAAVLEGRWLNQAEGHSLVATEPASVLEGGAAALAELPSWLAWHAGKYPAGAAIGFFSYELARFFESLPLVKNEILPDLSFAYYPQVARLRSFELSQAVGSLDLERAELCAHFDRPAYLEAVETIRGFIAAGDIYQANLTQQFSVPLYGRSPEEIYRRLAAGRAPFRAFLKTPAVTILSNSPERFFHVSTGRRILASPIKGTVARGPDAAQDEKRLLSSPKDRAENVMIVDLLRNDLGRICAYESIHARLWEVETLPHLYHLVSHVRGTLRPDVGVLEILRALFPCGSITGAPKIRAIELLAEIEKLPRGVSMGAIGIITAGGEMDFNVAIRTLAVTAGVAVFNVGGGIVYDSSPEAEYEEMMLKARPLLEALGSARQALETVHA